MKFNTKEPGVSVEYTLPELLRKIGVAPHYLQVPPCTKRDPRRSYFITGPCGRGKSWQTVAILGALLESSAPDLPTVKWLSFPELACDLRDNFDTASEIIRELQTKTYLFIDDFGAARPTEFLLDQLVTLIAYRYDRDMHIHINGNLGLDRIAKYYDERISSRLEEMCDIIKMFGPNRREKK